MINNVVLLIRCRYETYPLKKGICRELWYFISMADFELDFQDTAIAFADKSDAELREKQRLFRLMNSRVLNEVGTRSAELALSIGLPIEWIIKNTIFEQFCGGETISECQPTVDRLGNYNIGTILDYSVEGKDSEDDFDRMLGETLKNLDRAKNDSDIPFAVFKTTGIARFGTLERASKTEALSDLDNTRWKNAQERFNRICSRAAEIGQPVFVDAEESWIQDSIDNLAIEAMSKFNREKPIIFNTVQLYRHDRLEFLRRSHRKAKEDGYILAVKLVRGAYMEKERERAEELGYESPIQPDKASTDQDYDKAVEYCLDNVDELAFVAGTHNEASTKRLAQQIDKRGLDHNHPHVFFSQLYGMSDNLSYVLADRGYNVSKYVPYGPVSDAVPYLIRRARENSSVTGQMSRELEMINREIKRRSGE